MGRAQLNGPAARITARAVQAGGDMGRMSGSSRIDTEAASLKRSTAPRQRKRDGRPLSRRIQARQKPLPSLESGKPAL